MAPFLNWRFGNNFAHKQKEIELVNRSNKAQLAIDESECLTSTFINNMSHEMCTPLNNILGLSQLMLKSNDLNPKIQNDVKMIMENGKTLLSFVNNILDDTKLSNGEIKLRKTPNCLNSLMNKLYNSFQNSPTYINKKDNVELICEKPSKNIAITCDPERLNQILVNLIDNALKFTETGTVRFGYFWSINTISKDQYITFFVKDTGIGIEKNKIETIFERFSQVDKKMTRKYRGAGLGLHISKSLVKLMGGKIWCESEKGKGTDFYFRIPYSPVYTLQNDETPQLTNDKSHNWSAYTVLIVEDDIINYKVLGGMLRNTKVSIIHSDNGVKAIEQVRLNPKIDLVLMDIQLPEMNGLEATSKILEINPTLPIIAQTTNEREKCLEAGCIDYIPKPIDMNVLVNKMSKFLSEN